MKSNLQLVKEVLSDYRTMMILIIGTLINIIGINLFLVPFNLYPIGLMGLSFEINEVIYLITNTTIPENILFFVLNIPLFILSWKKIGKKFTIKTIIVVSLMTFYMAIIPNDVIIIDDIFLSVVFSAIIAGFGLGILLNSGTSTGGSDIIALFMSLIKGKTFGTFNTIFNSFIIFFAVLLTQDIFTGVYMLIFVYFFSTSVDRTHKMSKKYTLLIVTSQEEAVKTQIYGSETERGVTILNSQGGFTNNPNKTLMITCEHSELYYIIDLIKVADENVFISVLDTDTVIGTFENSYKKRL